MRYNKKLRNSVLRKYYPSIFDGENKKEFNFINDLKK